jgi:hypothetical protein
MLNYINPYSLSISVRGRSDTTTEAEGRREQVQYGVLPSLAGEEWAGRCDLYYNGRSVLPALLDGAQCCGTGMIYFGSGSRSYNKHHLTRHVASYLVYGTESVVRV